MKYILSVLSGLLLPYLVADEVSASYGSFSGRLQSLSMTRDYEGVGTGANSTLGVVFNYQSPVWQGLDLGLGYNYAWEIWENHNSGMLLNDDITVLNEAWIRYVTACGAEVTVGRKINNGSVFRKDDYRQKARSVEGAQLSYAGLTVGHALRMSNWIQSGSRWEFNRFDRVFGVEQSSDGVSWIEGTRQVAEGLDITVFDAYAWDICNLLGTRIEWVASANGMVKVYGRMEEGTGESSDQNSLAYGISYLQTLGHLAIEPGFFSVHGDTLFFQETTTGIDHALGSVMMICSTPFNGGADSGYIKSTYSLDKTQFYGLYIYTHHQDQRVNGQELDFVIKQTVSDHLSVCVKTGWGQRSNDADEAVTVTDARLFVTYVF